MASDNGEGTSQGEVLAKVVGALVNGDGDDSSQVHSPHRADGETESLAGEPLHVQAAYEFLRRKHITLWAEHEVFSHHGRLRAARWLAREMAGVEKILTSSWGPE